MDNHEKKIFGWIIETYMIDLMLKLPEKKNGAAFRNSLFSRKNQFNQDIRDPKTVLEHKGDGLWGVFGITNTKNQENRTNGP